jgi:hypothetical protein
MLGKIIALVRNEPAQVAGSLQALIALAVTLGLSLTPGETGALEAFTTAALALVPAVLARQVRVSLLTGFATAVVTLLIAFGVKGISPGTVSAVNAAVTVIAGMVLRGNVTTLATLRARARARAKAAAGQ